jgi:DNA polymerase I-like protein with 3'-5' exonuclease and polymerase domains/uracil-DNA glycosylase
MSEHKYIPGSGPIGAKMMLLLECPTYEDVLAGKLFSKPGETARMLHESGINPNECWITSVSKYYVPPNEARSKKKIPFAVRAKNAGIEIAKQLEELQSEINSIKPNTILGLGKSALWALTGQTNIESYRGSILSGMGCKFIPTYNPAHLSWQAADIEFKGYWNRQIMLFDMRRAKAQSTFPDIRRPSRTLQIAKNSYELYEFIQRYKDKTRLAADIEALGTCIPACIGFAFTKSHGICVPLWNTGGISEIPTADMVQMWVMVADLLANRDIIGQNFNYDRDKIKRLGFKVNHLVSDIMLKAHAINPELGKSLAFTTSLYTEEPFYKNEGMYHGKIEDLFTGCARDACVTIEVDEAMDADLDEIQQRPFFENFLMKLPDLYWAIENQGFRQDTTERDRLLRKYIEWDEKLRYELFQLTGTEINVNSPTQIATLLFDNFKLPRRAGTGEEEITALLNNQTTVKDKNQRRVLELILEDRRVRKSISTYLMALPDYDDRMRTTCYMCLETGRTSTGQQDPPIRPTVEVVDENGKKKDKVLGIAFQTMTKHGDIGADIRGMYVPDVVKYTEREQTFRDYCHANGIAIQDDEEVFVQADSSQAEARVVWLLAGDEEALELVDKIDYHALTATWFFGGVESDYSKKVLGYEHPIRFAGKTLRHAGHLGAGKRRAAVSVNTDARKYKIPISITESIAERALIIFHSKQPKIQQVFHASVEACIKRSRTLVAPIPWGIDAPYGGRRTFYERYGDELLRQAFSYLPQRAVTDNTKAAGLRIRERIPGIKIVMEAHDALLFSIRRSLLAEQIPIIRKEMERPISFRNCSIPRRSLSIPCDVEIGTNYKDLKKFKDYTIEDITAPPVPLKMPPKSITESFLADTVPVDTKLDSIIYNSWEDKQRGQSH